MSDERAFCVACGHLVGRVTDRAVEKQRAAIDAGHRKFCKPAANLIAAIRYASVDDNDEPDPAAVLAGATTAYLEHHHPALFDELGTEPTSSGASDG